MIYLAILILQIILVYRYDVLHKKHNKWNWYLFIEVLLILIAGLRYRLGVDSIRYESTFQFLPKLWEIDYRALYEYSYDPLYLLFASTVRSVTEQFWVMQLAQAILVNCIVFWFIRRNTNKPFIAVLLYSVFLYINFMCEVMREACAVAMFLVAWEKLRDDKYIQSVLYCVLATLFHTSAIFLILVPLAKRIGLLHFCKVNYKSIIILLLVFLLASSLQNSIFSYLSFLENVGNVGDKIDRYAETELAGGILNIFGILVSLIPQAMLPYFAIGLLKKRDRINFIDIEPMVFMCMLCCVITIPIAIFYRLNNYFMLFAIIAISRVAFDNIIRVGKIRITHSRVLWTILIMGMFFCQYIGWQSEVGGGKLREYMRYYPYSTVLNPKVDQNREMVFNYYNAY